MQARYVVHEGNLERLEKKVARLNSAARKLGCREIEVQIVGEEYRKVELEDGREAYRRFVVVEVQGEAPQLNGWSFVATIQHEPEGNIIRALPGEHVPEYFRTAPRKCDHCQQVRLRKDTYIVRNAEGQFKQVGRNCLKDFLGHADPHAYAEYLENLQDVLLTTTWEQVAGGEEYWDIREYLKTVLAVIREHGWTSRSRAEAEGFPSTAEIARTLFLGPRPDLSRVLARLTEKEPQADQLIDRALEWIRGLEPQNDYLHNLKVACSQDLMNPRNYSLVASLIPAYKKATVSEGQQQRRPESKHVGKVGEKVEVLVKVLRTMPLDGAWGITTLHIMEDREGNELVWFASTTELEEGRWYRLRGRVKKHDEYRGRKRTVLTGCRAEELETA